MAANQWAQAVRVQLGIGRVLPLGGPGDGAWITEQAAAGALRAAAGTPAGVHLGSLRLSVADQVRTALLEAAVRELGLVVGVVDLQVSELLEEGEAPSPPPAGRAQEPPAPPAADEGSGATPEGPAGIPAVARGVPGVARLAPVLGGASRAVRCTDGHVLIQLATAPGYRALDVSSAVRRAVAAAPAAPSTVAVLVTAVERS
ncbi:hypothetical protein BX261_1573 [Streptomyces sp. 2321.6]|uniref:hypothetical protein n=1 Tax=Streptomyces sp. 2321.6 TaxID=1938840 RepID=UPI000BB123E4|nr:hypothetical protein [Streptomyces sp. 2321.6]PBC81692.1 hypothetical protein BX261_1573 [Streptomyces sp. 2321.6]